MMPQRCRHRRDGKSAWKFICYAETCRGFVGIKISWCPLCGALKRGKWIRRPKNA